MSHSEIEQRNLALIQSVYPQYMDILTSFPSYTNRFEIQEQETATYLCKWKDTQEWIHGPANPWQWAEHQIRQTDWTKQRLFVILRPGLGYVPLSLYPNMRKGRLAQRMLLVEDRFDLFRLSLRLFDWTDVLRSDRSLLLLTENPAEALMKFFIANPVALLSPLSVMNGGIQGKQEQQIMTALQPHLSEMAQTVHGAAQQYLRELHDHYQIVKQKRSHRKKVLLVEPEHDYLAQPIAKAFQEEDCDVQIYRGNRRLLRFLNPYNWLVYTREHFPDVLLWMNRNTLSPEGVETLAPLPIKKVLWFLDSPKRVQTSTEELQATDAYFSFDRSYLPYLEELCGRQGFFLSTAAGIRPLEPCSPGRSWPEREGPAVGFMGALAADRFQEVRAFWVRRDPEFVTILDQIVEDYLADPSLSLEKRYNQSQGIDRLPFSGFVVLYLEERTTYLRRLRFLKPLKQAGLVTFGAVEWGKKEWAEELAPCYSGEKPSYAEDLPRIYYHTKVNINIFHVQCEDSTNPRVYDVLAAGGFLLTEYRPQIEREFRIGEHLDCFRTAEEALEKAQYYLQNPSKREEICRRGQEFVLNHATYRHRIREMLSLLESNSVDE